MDKQKYVYIALIYIPSAVGLFTKICTMYGYSHATISFDENLNECHAFSRLKKDTTFLGGYVKENKTHYTYKPGIKVNTRIYKVPVTEEELNKIKDFIKEISEDKEYIYNLYSMCTLAILRGFRTYKAFHCTEFIGKILTFISSVKMSRKWYKYLPRDFNRDLKQYMIYKGILDTTDEKIDPNDYFFTTVDKKEYRKKRIYVFKELLYRLVHKKVSPNFDYRKARFL